jgi:prevent-host-death family protein
MSNATVGIRELKSRLSSYLERVQEGETITITDRGQPMGQIVPMRRLPTAASRVLALTQSGIIAWNGQKLRPTSPRTRARGKHTVAELLLDDRE